MIQKNTALNEARSPVKNAVEGADSHARVGEQGSRTALDQLIEKMDLWRATISQIG